MLPKPQVAPTGTRRCTQAVTRMPVHRAHATLRQPEIQQSQSVLEWASGKPVAELACSIVDMGFGRGRGLVANMDVPTGRTLLSVPFNRVYRSEPEDELELHWSAEMAMRLLRDRHVCATATAPAVGAAAEAPKRVSAEVIAAPEPRLSEVSQPDNKWCPWLSSLPSEVRTPLGFGPAALAAVRDPQAAAEIMQMQECVRASFEVLEPELQALGCEWSGFLGAVQLLHSRCFYHEGCHLAVPGIDMCNHSPTPSARVEVQHSPGAVQGMAALEEVADPATWGADVSEPSRFLLVAGPAGIARGEEVTISYGSWPDMAFFLLFGFLPEDNPHNAVVLFAGLEEVTEALVDCLLTQAAAEEQQQQSCNVHNSVSYVLQELNLCAALQRLSSGIHPTRATAGAQEGQETRLFGEFAQLIVSCEGWDGRMDAAVRIACDAITIACDQALNDTGHGTRIASPTANGGPAVVRLHQAAHKLAVQQREAESQDGVATGILPVDGVQAQPAQAWRDAVRGVVMRGCKTKLALLSAPYQPGAAQHHKGVAVSEAVDIDLAVRFTERQVHVLTAALEKLG